MKETSLRSFATINARIVHCLSDDNNAIVFKTYIITRSGTRLNSISIKRVIHVNTKRNDVWILYAIHSLEKDKKFKWSDPQLFFAREKKYFLKGKNKWGKYSIHHSLRKDKRVKNFCTRSNYDDSFSRKREINAKDNTLELKHARKN